MKKIDKIDNNRKRDDEIKSQIKSLYNQIEKVQKKFDIYTDFDLIDYCIYETQALKSKYRYLNKQLKKENNIVIQKESVAQME